MPQERRSYWMCHSQGCRSSREELNQAKTMKFTSRNSQCLDGKFSATQELKGSQSSIAGYKSNWSRDDFHQSKIFIQAISHWETKNPTFLVGNQTNQGQTWKQKTMLNQEEMWNQDEMWRSGHNKGCGSETQVADPQYPGPRHL